MRRQLFLYIFFLGFLRFSYAQAPAIGNWRDHLPYHQSISVQAFNGTVYAATPYSLFAVALSDNTISRLSKTNGLSEVGIAATAYDSSTGNLIVAYTNSNLDILQQNKIRNIPDLKQKNISGNKTVKKIFCSNGFAYCATGFGIVVIDEAHATVKDTYIIGSTGDSVAVNDITEDNQYLYAATNQGVKRALFNQNNLSDFRSWEDFSASPLATASLVAKSATYIYTVERDSVLRYDGTAWHFFYADGWNVNNISIQGSMILLSEDSLNKGRVIVLDETTQVLVNINLSSPSKPLAAVNTNNQYWVADSVNGLLLYANNELTSFAPNSPQSIASGDMIFVQDTLWVAAGGVGTQWQPSFNSNGIFAFKNGEWTNYNGNGYPQLQNVYDFISLAGTSSAVYAGSFGAGLLTVAGQDLQLSQSGLGQSVSRPGAYQVAGLSVDASADLWISNYGASNPLVIRMPSGESFQFAPPFIIPGNPLGAQITDNFNQQWIVLENGNGLLCYNHGQSASSAADDSWKLFLQGQGFGNLPDNRVLCLANDKNSIIWVGTANGIGIIQCAQQVFTGGCEATIPVVQFDNFAGYLFFNERVQTIAVDGANRKWIGTANGVWLITEDAQKIIYHFTAENSSLLSDNVLKIAINPLSGEVFFATHKGICSFRSTATEGTTSNTNVLVFPNPVPPGYSGTIAIKGLANNAIVKITELDGRLVYQTRALGGQAIWDGRNYKGGVAASGVYLVIVSDDNRRENLVTKIVFVGR